MLHSRMKGERPTHYRSTSSGIFHTPDSMLLEVHLTSVLGQTKSLCTVTSLSSAKTQDMSTHLLQDDASPKVNGQPISRYGSSPSQPSHRLPRKTSTYTKSTLIHYTQRRSTNRMPHALRDRRVTGELFMRTMHDAVHPPPPRPARPEKKAERLSAQRTSYQPTTPAARHTSLVTHQEHTPRGPPPIARTLPNLPERHHLSHSPSLSLAPWMHNLYSGKRHR